MDSGFGELRAQLAAGLGGLRADMIERNQELVKGAYSMRSGSITFSTIFPPSTLT